MNKKTFMYRLVVFALFSILTVGPATASTDILPVRLSGFGTIGLSNAGNDDLGFRRELSQKGQFGNWQFKTDSSLGVQLDVNFSQRWSTAVQLVAKNRIQNSVARSVDWAYIKFQANDHWTMRAGRMALDMYRLTDYRNVGFAYLWVRPVVEFYSIVLTNRYDGIDFSYKARMNDSMVDLRMFYGQSENIIATALERIEFKMESIYGIKVNYQRGAYSANLVFAEANLGGMNEYVGTRGDALNAFALISSDIWPAVQEVSDAFKINGSKARYNGIGLAYDKARWVLQSEIASVDSDYALAPSYNSAYLSAGYRLRQDITPYFVLSKLKTTDDFHKFPMPVTDLIPAVNDIYEAANASANSTRADQRKVSVGLRWNLNAKTALKIQYDNTVVSRYGNALYEYSAPSYSARRTVLDTLTITFDFIF